MLIYFLFNSDYWIQFDTVKIINIPYQQCTKNAKCYFVDKKQIFEQYKATKILDTNIPKYIKFECNNERCWFKIYDTI